MVTQDSPIPAPFVSEVRTVLPEWIDFNGHMNIAYYVVAFDLATDDAFNFFGIDDQHREKSNCSTFTLELHVNYLLEIMEGEPFLVHTTVLAVDAKRLHLFHEMFHAKTGELVATNEIMFVHVDMKKRRSTPFHDHILARLQEIAAVHASLPRPPNAGRSIGF
ncbi:MAG: thioesterase family protein [Rhodospirillales bacterium]|nr:thioesterase family protein [Rhodospirillales bacterium]